MARLPRISSRNYLFYVSAQGNNRQPIFFELADYERFLQILDRYESKFKFHLYAYCLMPTRFHLLVRPERTDLSTIMQAISTAYSMYVNKNYDRVGHVFQGRFKSIIVEKERYALEVVRFLHLNPVRGGL